MLIETLSRTLQFCLFIVPFSTLLCLGNSSHLDVPKFSALSPQLLGSTRIHSSSPLSWKPLKAARRPQGSPHSYPVFQEPLVLIAWYAASWKLAFHVSYWFLFVSVESVNTVSVTTPWSEGEINLFLFIAENIPSCRCASLFIHSLIEGLRSFQFWATRIKLL